MAAKAKGANATPETTAKKHGAEHLASTKWQPGVSPNPAGRPKGSRHKLGTAFIDDLYAAWQTQGKDVIARVIEERPHEFLKSVASILPKEIEVKTTAVQDLSDDDIAAALIALRSVGALAGFGDGTEEKARH